MPHTEGYGSTSDGKIATLPPMTRWFLLGHLAWDMVQMGHARRVWEESDARPQGVLVAIVNAPYVCAHRV